MPELYMISVNAKQGKCYVKQNGDNSYIVEPNVVGASCWKTREEATNVIETELTKWKNACTVEEADVPDNALNVNDFQNKLNNSLKRLRAHEKHETMDKILKKIKELEALNKNSVAENAE